MNRPAPGSEISRSRALVPVPQPRWRLRWRRVAGIFHQPGAGAPRAWSRGAAVGTATARAFARHRSSSRGPWRYERRVSLLLTLMLTLTLAARAFARHRLTSRGPWRCRGGVSLQLTLTLTLTLTLCPYTRAAACGLRGEGHAQSLDLLRPVCGCDRGGRAARSDRPEREPRARRHPRHPGGDCRGGRPLHGVARCGVHIVAPDSARDADLDSLRRHQPGALGEAPGRRPHPDDVLPRARRRQLLPAPRRQLLRIHAGYRRQRIRPGVPLRRGDRRSDAGVGRRPVAELARTVLEPGRPDGLRLDAPQRRRPRHLRGRPG